MRRKRDRLKIPNETNTFIELESAFRGNLKTYFLKNTSSDIKDICLLLSFYKAKMKELIANQVTIFGGLKFNIVVECTYEKPLTEEKQDRAFKTKNNSAFHDTDLDLLLHDLILAICREESNYQGRGSGWSLLNVDGILIRINRYRPLGGSTYLPLPQIIVKKMAVINPKNTDNECFKWAVSCHFIKGFHRERVNNRHLIVSNLFNFDNISFPTPIRQIKIFEKNNSKISINVYGLNKNNHVFPLLITSNEKAIHIDLLYITNDKDVSHYCYISNFSRLLANQQSKHREKKIFCKRCLSSFTEPCKEIKLEKHKKICCLGKPIRAVMPKKEQNCNPVLKFKNFQNIFKLPIVLYADFESILVPENRQLSKYTHLDNIHHPMSFCVYLVYTDDIPDNIREALPSEPYLYRGTDAAEQFMSYVVDLINLIGKLINVNVPMLPLTQEEIKRVKEAKHCEACNKMFTSIYRPQRDHCHLTGIFRSVLCSNCNLRRQQQKYIPIFIHGSSNYDSHFIVKQLGFDKRNIQVIPNSIEKYITFTKQTSSGLKIRFIDTYKIMSCNLATLVKNLPSDKFIHIRKFFNERDMRLVTRKGVYPYEYTSCWEKLEERRLPSKECFRNTLDNTDISNEDYQHALDVWSHFNIETLGEYSDLYLKLDVLLLSDVFENFRELCLNSYQLDCAYYLTLPSFTFDAMLKSTKVEMDLLTDYEMYLFIESGIRGGITSLIKRNCEANNPYMGDLYNPNKQNSYLMYFDCNNLYGDAMSRPIPLKNFKWYEGDVNKFPLMSIPIDADIGYFLEVDIEYPNNLHDLHNDIPFLPVSECPPHSNQKKLLTTFKLKKNYICHYVNLKQAISNGLVLLKIHRILQFNQSSWLKSYIDFNTLKRQQAINSFEKDFYKLLNNSLFGKTIENIRKRMNLELVSSEKRIDKLIKKPTFLDRIIYNENLSAVQCSKETIYFNKPIYVGFSVLELSKTIMYDFHYNVMKKKYGSKLSVLYIDTDCFFYEILTNDFYEDMISDPKFIENFDLSDYPSNHKCFNHKNKKVLGKFKDVCDSKILTNFIGLRPKLYCFKNLEHLNQKMLNTNEPTVSKKAKGVTSGVVDRNITFLDYENCLLNDLVIRREIKLFRSFKHEIKTLTINKIALSAKDDKRHICENGIDTLAYDHYSII